MKKLFLQKISKRENGLKIMNEYCSINLRCIFKLISNAIKELIKGKMFLQ